MNAPTPADVRRLEPFFDWTDPIGHVSVARRRARALAAAADQADRLAKALGALRTRDERDLDLNLERYRRVAARFDMALDALDVALADPNGPTPTAPTAKEL